MQPFHWTLLGLVVVPVDILFVGAALAWIVAVVRKQAPVRWSPFYLPLAAYLVAMVVATVASEDPWRSARKLLAEIYLLGLGVLAFNVVRSLRAMRLAATAWIVGTMITVVAALVGIVFFYAGVTDRTVNLTLSHLGSLPPGNYPRTTALFLNPNMLCSFLVIAFAILLGMMSVGWLGAKAALTMAFGLCITAFFTLSPGLAGLALVGGHWTWAHLRGSRHRRLRAFVAASTAAVAVAGVAATLISPAGIQWQAEPSSRVMVWRTAWDTIRQSPWVGRGLGLDVASARYVNASGKLEVLTDAHNTYLSIAGQMGALGLAAFVILIIYLLRAGRGRGSRGPEAIVKSAVLVGFNAGFLYQTLSGSFEDTRHVWVLIGLVAAAAEGLAGPPDDRTPLDSAG